MLACVLSAASAVLLGACSVIGVRSGTEEPRFEVVGHQGTLEIRRYAPRLAAETVVEADSVEAARSEGFRRLAGYIFGGNRSRAKIAMTAPVAQASNAQASTGQAAEKIAMTAPVVQEAAGEGRWTIRFFMPATFTPETLPVPADARVTIAAVPAATMAIHRYTGVPNAAAVAAGRATLLAALADGPWAASGEPEDWFYDPPWTLPPLRRNEAAVSVTPRQAGSP